jgi:hypothetical protein
MILPVIENDGTSERQATALCGACGLCCTGRLFIWVKLKPSELDPAERLGMRVYRSDPTQRGFSLPCPLWKGDCPIHASPHYPRACRAYQCKLLKELLGERAALAQALGVVERARGMIAELEAMLGVPAGANFREWLVARIEQPEQHPLAEGARAEFQEKAEALLRFYAEQFGVTDLLE